MIAEKTNTAQQLIERISLSASKINYINDEVLSNALMQLENDGLPNNKHEDYKYCNLDAVIKKEFKNIEQKFLSVENIDAYKIPETYTIAVINGTFSAELSSKNFLQTISLKSLSKTNALENKNIASLANVQQDAFIALNTAYSQDGFYLEIKENTVLEKPIHVIYISNASSETFVNARNFILVGKNSQVHLIEEQINLSGKNFTNFLSEKLVQQNATLNCITLQNQGLQGYSINTNQVQISNASNYKNVTITLSGQVVRNNHNVAIAGENAEANLFGYFSAKQNQLIDNHTLIDHQVPNCVSNELYKGIANDKSIGVFNGKIFVQKDAQKTNAYQSSKNILLSDDATINTKPQLEIYANDVKCSHGTSTGKIDESALFYLQARGIGKAKAQEILLASFANEVIQMISNEYLKEKIQNYLE